MCRTGKSGPVKFTPPWLLWRTGGLIMTTHTTSQAPQHPTWMAEGYYQHLWEGFPGSHLLLYDPETGILENRGIPAPSRDAVWRHLRPAAPRVLLRRHDPGARLRLFPGRQPGDGSRAGDGVRRLPLGYGAGRPRLFLQPDGYPAGGGAGNLIPPFLLPGFSDPQPAQRRENRAGRAAVHAGGVGGLPVRLRLRPKPAGQSGQLRARRAEMAP